MKALNIFLNHFGGNKSAAARSIGESPQLVHTWAKHPSGDMPIKYVPAAAKAIGKTFADLRPDLIDS